MALSVAACKDDTARGGDGGSDDESCPPGLSPKLDKLEEVTAAASTRVAALKAAVAVACANIATGLGQNVIDVTDPDALTAEDVSTLCNVAASAIDAEVQANGGYAIDHAGGYCAIDYDGQSACESELASGSCETEPLDARCLPEAIYGVCTGGCNGHCVAPGGVDCAGPCHGICRGTCDGSCSGGSSSACDGICDGNCMGVCEGQCDSLPPSVMCVGVCFGRCDATLESSFCSEPLTPVSDCSLEEGCRAACRALGSIAAACEPVITYAEGNSTLEPLLVANLPPLYDAALLTGKTTIDGLIELVEAIPQSSIPSDGGCAQRHAALFGEVTEDAGTLAAIAELSWTFLAGVEANGS